MPRKLPEECIIDYSGSYTVRQPRGIDLRALANERGLKVNAFLRLLILEYVANQQQTERIT